MHSYASSLVPLSSFLVKAPPSLVLHKNTLTMQIYTCTQNGIVFDQAYGWELSLLEPNDFWDHVPQVWKPIYHFFNVPISSDINANENPLRLIKDIAKEEDFVSFKLDVDAPEVEIPIALELLKVVCGG